MLKWQVSLGDQKRNDIICQRGTNRTACDISSEAWAAVNFLSEVLTSPSICLQSAPFQMVKDVKDVKGGSCDIQNHGPEIKVLVWVSQRQQRNLRGCSVSVRA